MVDTALEITLVLSWHFTKKDGLNEKFILTQG